MASHRTYIPGLRLVCGIASRYLNHWQTKLEAGSTSEQITCLRAAIAALNALLLCYQAIAPGP